MKPKPPPTLINGKPTTSVIWPEVVDLRIGTAHCTGTVIGSRTIITAAHCAKTGETATFEINKIAYAAKMTQSTLYPTNDLDLCLGIVDKEIPIQPATVGGTAEVTGVVHLLGYGCLSQFGGGNDGVLREGNTVITGFSGFDAVSQLPGGAAVCFGDSGGPGFDLTRPRTMSLLTVNSKGNIRDTNYTTRLDIPESQNFLKKFAVDNQVEICGINKTCTPKH